MTLECSGVSADLQASYQRLKSELITDLGAGDIGRYRELAESRAANRDVVQRTYNMCSEEMRLDKGLPITRLWSTDAPEVARTIVVFLHGGGLIAGNRYDGLDVVLEPAAELNAEVWTVEYGLAPETTFGAAVEQCFQAVDAACSANRGPVIIAGQSAGGGLAAAVTLLDRDRTGGRLAGQLLVCPMLDDRSDTASMRQFDSDPLWSRVSNLTAWQAALGGTGHRAGITPAGHRNDLEGLPPTYLDSGSAEVFRDDIVEWASRLWGARVPTELHVWEGGYHGFDGAAPSASVSLQARAARITWLARILSGGVQPLPPGRRAISSRVGSGM